MLEDLFVALMGQKKVKWSLRKKNRAWVSTGMNREYMQVSNVKSKWPGTLNPSRNGRKYFPNAYDDKKRQKVLRNNAVKDRKVAYNRTTARHTDESNSRWIGAWGAERSYITIQSLLWAWKAALAAAPGAAHYGDCSYEQPRRNKALAEDTEGPALCTHLYCQAEIPAVWNCAKLSTVSLPISSQGGGNGSSRTWPEKSWESLTENIEERMKGTQETGKVEHCIFLQQSGGKWRKKSFCQTLAAKLVLNSCERKLLQKVEMEEILSSSD